MLSLLPFTALCCCRRPKKVKVSSFTRDLNRVPINEALAEEIYEEASTHLARIREMRPRKFLDMDILPDEVAKVKVTALGMVDLGGVERQ